MDPFLTFHTKINSKWIRYLNVKKKSIRRKHGKMAKLLYTQRKTKLFLNHEKNMCQIKRKMTGWDTVFATHSADFKLTQHIKN